MADAEVSSRPYVATYGRRQQRREETPLSDVEGQSSQPSPRPRDALFLDSSPVHNGGASRRSRNATNDDGTGNTSASSSDDARQATSKSRSTASGAARTRPELSRLISDDSDDDDDDNAGSQNALDRIRAQLRGPTSSGSSGSRRDATSSLSSAPSLSQPSRAGKGIPGLSDSEDDEADRTMTSRPSRVGLLAGRMKARITTTSSNDGPSRSLPSQRSASPRRSFTLSDDDDSASSLSDSAPDSQVEQSRKDRLAATQRKQKLEQMAAKRRQATAAAEPEVEVSLEDDFFNQADEDAPATDDPIRSSSTAGHDDDSDEDLPDAREVARRAAARGQQPGGKASGSRDKHKSSSKSQKAAKAPKGPKPLSKKEQEEMRKMQAKIERSRPMPSLALQSHPVDRQEYGIAQLAAKFKQQPETQASPESDDPIEMDTPRRPVAVASAAKSKPSLPSPASLLPQTGRSSDSIVVSNAEDAKRRKAQEALRLRKQKWLQSQEENAQRPFMSAATADSIESQGSDDLVFDLAGPSRNGKDDDDDLILVDTPKGASGSKGKVASRLFAGKLQERSTNGGAAKSKGPPARNNSRQAPAGMSTTDFKQSMLDKIKRQNISIRAAREQQAGPRAQQQQQTVSASTTSELTDESSADALKRIGERAKGQPDAEDEVDDDGDAGSEDEDFAPEGSGSEEEEDEDEIEESGAKAAAAGSEDEEDPLEDEEDVMPPSSQNTNRSLGRTGMENDDSDEDEDEELHTARPSKKRAQRVVADEEDEEEQQRQQREQEEQPDATAAAVGPSSASRPAAHSFGGPAGLTQFFQDTQASAAAAAGVEEDHPESESQKLIAAEAAAAAAAAAGGKPSSTFAGPRPTNDSVLGQFFADTQLSQSPRGQSLDVIGATGRARNADHFAFAMGESSGSGVGGDALSQFFNEGTQVGTREAAGGEQAPQQPFAVGSMGPPTAIPADGFAALRRQAQGDGQDLLGSPDSVLPTPEFSGDEHGLDSHLKTPQSISAAAAPKQYLNHEGFFTQTRPIAPAPESAGGARSAQGGDSFGANASQWAGESSSQLQQRGASEAEGESYQEPSSPSADTARRKRFRRAAMPDEEDSEEQEVEQHEDDEEEEEEDDGDSRGSASDTDGHDHLDNVPADSDASEPEDDDVHPGATANAWEVLKRAAQRADQANAASNDKSKKKRRHQYIEGEAEESEDEEGGPTRKAGGLKGVFDASDDEGNDESDSEDDGADLEGLVDDVKERDEAAKDKLALARYQQDLDVDEAAALALAEKAAKGELRGKRRKGRAGQGGLEDLLDDDFDEERLKRMASRPKGWVSKRRKLEGGDGMDLLASKAESRAFVEGYAETHQSNVGGDEYSFLVGAEDEEEEDEEDSDGDEDEDEDEERDAAAGAADDRPDDDLDELDRVFAQRITRKELAKELQERRKKRRRLGQLASDDEEEEEERQQQEKASMPPASRDFFATDESDNDDDDGRAGPSFRRSGAASKAKAKALPSYLHDRINSTNRPSAANPSHNKRTHSHTRAHESDDDEDEDHDVSADPALALVEGLKRRRAVSPRTAARLAKVAAEYGDRNEAYTGAQGGGGGGGGSSITSFGARAARQQSGGGVDRQKAGAGAFAKASGGGAAGGGGGGEREGRRPMGISSSASSGLLAKRVVEESQ